MSIQAVSSNSAALQLQAAVSRIQRQLSDTQIALSSGKPADYGATLGMRAGLLEALEQQQSDVTTIQQTNAIASTRLDATNSALSSMLSDVQSFASATVQGQPGTYSISALQTQAKAALASLRAGLNTNVAGEYVFGGVNSGSAVMAQDPTQAGSSADSAFQAAFQAEFGFNTASPSVANITATQITSFIQNNMAALFDSTNWKANWSTASDTSLQSRIQPGQNAETSLSGNDPAFAQAAQAYSIISELPLSGMNTSAVSAAIAAASSTASTAVLSMSDAQVRVGVMQSDVANANATLSSQATTLANGIAAFNPVDPYSMSMQITQMQTQLQMAYSLTAQLQHLSLAQYI